MKQKQTNNEGLALLYFLGFTFVVFILGLWGLKFFSGISVLKSVLLGYITSVINIIAGFISLKWAFKQKAKAFYITLYGGMALRFMLFIVIMFVLYFYFPEWSLVAFVLSFIVFYVFMQFFEIKLVNRELKRNKVF